ncbi:hypothetical protein C922_00941 [Plasmodium inui San Antonio 1]|uniref:Uncharacterized protein n=1 Tax=Plasmodium inui San Antonio 1 TaxID=1237626 RepID=W7A5Z5_9APIC|nr:hypothetical protein C922_00941 [Plasmodium inui San Antonio 1]EUD68542.1 hypothetical protein C922_00941 [Plasmodium inui San Antonio 1]
MVNREVEEIVKSDEEIVKSDEETVKSDDETANPHEEDGKRECKRTTGNCTGEFLAHPNDNQEKDCYEERDTEEGYSNRNANSKMPRDLCFDRSLIENWGGEKGSIIHKEKHKEEGDGADRVEDPKTNDHILCVEIETEPKDEDASSPVMATGNGGPFHSRKSYPGEEADVPSETGQVGHTGRGNQETGATREVPNRSYRNAGEGDEKLSTDFICTREHLDRGKDQQSKDGGHKHNGAKEEDVYCRIDTYPTVGTIRVAAICRNDSNNVSVKVFSDFHACKEGSQKRKEELSGGWEEEGKIMREGGNDSEGSGGNDNRGEATSGARSEPTKGATSGIVGEPPNTDPSVGKISDLGHASSKYTEGAFSQNTNALNDGYHLANEKISQNDLIKKKKNLPKRVHYEG